MHACVRAYVCVFKCKGPQRPPKTKKHDNTHSVMLNRSLEATILSSGSQIRTIANQTNGLPKNAINLTRYQQMAPPSTDGINL